MALKNCRECKKKVSTEALTCPNCGVPNPTKNFSKMKESEFILAERKQNADRAKLINDYYKDNKTSGVKDTFNMSTKVKIFGLLSIVWLLAIYSGTQADYGSDDAGFIWFGVMPLIIGWGIYLIRKK